MMNGMSFSETIFLFFLALIIFGPKKLPEIARQIGKYMNEFRRASNEFKAQIEQEIAHLEVEDKKQTILPPSPPVDGATSRSQSLQAPDVSYLEAPANAETAVPASEATLAAPIPESTPTPSNGAEPPVATEAVHPAEVHPAQEEVTSRASQESHA
jgi:sec-independent protein translocase protein TatB